MREILFRGKTFTKEDYEWIYGYLYKEKEVLCISDDIYEIKGQVILKDTVGQFTGLLDKNGVKIFEGDIVKFTDYTNNENGCEGFDNIGAVEYGEFGFDITNRNYVDLDDTLCTVEIIGNIYDNPELPEGGTK
ncbi:MAG: YopX family protein [Lachnospiraceae bacterium]|jgi:uncharacterized phage protein (TIGR01671 family)|nr:YopX family protein [Lachnospiraceae bacterium]